MQSSKQNAKRKFGAAEHKRKVGAAQQRENWCCTAKRNLVLLSKEKFGAACTREIWCRTVFGAREKKRDWCEPK